MQTFNSTAAQLRGVLLGAAVGAALLTNGASAQVGPTTRYAAPIGSGARMLATEPTTGTVIGLAAPLAGTAMRTLRWDGQAFQTVATTGPSDRALGAMSGLNTQRVLLFGGETPGGVLLGDTWRWNGSAWQQLNLLVAPSPRSEPASAQMGAGPVYLFGGRAGGGAVLGDTWRFAGGQWTQINPPGPVPSARFGAAMGFDGVNRLILFGGADAAGNRLDDTWAFNGQQWTLLSTNSVVGGRNHAAMALDVLPALSNDGVRFELVMSGGYSNLGPASEVFRFTGAGWALLNGVSYSPVTGFTSAAVDTVRDTVLFSDAITGDATICGSTYTAFAAGCGCSLTIEGGATAPRIGTSIDLQLAGAPNRSFLLLWDPQSQPEGIALPAPIFPLGCMRWVGIDPGVQGAELLAPADPAGQASFTTALANSPALLGVRVHYQALDLLGCASNGLEVRIGR